MKYPPHRNQLSNAHLFIVLCFSFLASNCSDNTYTGTLLKKPWSKSTQSYCAQGSDYYVLKRGDKEDVVKYKSTETLAALQNKQVRIKGTLEEIHIEPPGTDVPTQVPDLGPTGGTFNCKVLRVRKIVQLE